MEKPFLHVVAGLLAKDGKVFIAQRKSSDSNPGRWEFPGGKVEEGEDPREALKRELQEELAIEVEVHRLFGSHNFETDRAKFQLELYRVQWLSGEIHLHEHDAMAWVEVGELANYDMLSGDMPFVERLQKIKL